MAEDSGALQEQLRTLDAEVAEMRQTVATLRRGIGESDAPVDAADIAAAITAAEEQEAVLRLLEAKRDKVQRQLAG